ncbi:unnamed protein product [Nezara viridula]|uniref:AAA+ ATPase domain-containing protein n=1 Tax=Nezara viridula TaxID=85310 RepID=A0A9P0HKR8_NEZVI|nr:unnamed protein product [Nezara viridula]
MDSDNRMEVKVEDIAQTYQETVKIFENLHKIFSEEDAPTLLTYYDICISRIGELISIETNEFLIECLENILNQIKWQQEKIRVAYSSGINPENKVTVNNLQCQDTVEPKGKLKDNNYEYRQEVIRSTLCQVTGNGLKDIVGLENVKLLLKNTILHPLKYPQLFTGGRKPWSQILLYGPPGTGKSKIASALAFEAKAQLYSISSADLLSSYIGESEKMIKDLFEFTRKNKSKCLVFIDEIDSICRRRNDREADHSRSIKNQLLIELDQNLNSENTCFIICATNCPWDIDVAFMRRFQCRLHISLPDRTSRIEIIKNKCEGIGLDISNEDWEIIGNETNGYSGSDLINLTSFALQEPITDLETSQTWLFQKGKWIPCAFNNPNGVKIPLTEIPPDKVGVRDVTLQDFMKAIEIVPKTLSDVELQRYNQFSNKN